MSSSKRRLARRLSTPNRHLHRRTRSARTLFRLKQRRLIHLLRVLRRFVQFLGERSSVWSLAGRLSPPGVFPFSRAFDVSDGVPVLVRGEENFPSGSGRPRDSLSARRDRLTASRIARRSSGRDTSPSPSRSADRNDARARNERPRVRSPGTPPRRRRRSCLGARPRDAPQDFRRVRAAKYSADQPCSRATCAPTRTRTSSGGRRRRARRDVRAAPRALQHGAFELRLGDALVAVRVEHRVQIGELRRRDGREERFANHSRELRLAQRRRRVFSSSRPCCDRRMSGTVSPPGRAATGRNA